MSITILHAGSLWESRVSLQDCGSH